MTNFDFLTNFEPIIADNIFTEEEYKAVYAMAEQEFALALGEKEVFDENNATNSPVFVNKYNGYVSMAKYFSPEIQESILAAFRRYVDLPDNVILNTHIARYSYQSGYSPSLRPHYDRGLTYPSYTMSIQLDKTLDWGLGANDVVANLGVNQGLIFSGSHQAHYRPLIEFKENDVYDVIVCQVQMKDYPKLDIDEQDKIMAETLHNYSSKLGYQREFHNIQPKAVENFFTPEEYASIYRVVNSAMDKGQLEFGDKYHHMPKITNNGFIVYLNEPEQFDKAITDKVKTFFESIVGEEVREVGVLFARYTKDSGSIPTLLPHGDRNEKHLALTLTVELDKTIDWDFYVEDKKFDMKNNLGVMFSGSHQIHWRPDVDFNNEDYYDIILLQTYILSDEDELGEEFFSKMDTKAMHYMDRYHHLMKNSIAKIRSGDKPQ